MSDQIERLLDNAATCSQERGMLDDGTLRECVRLNVALPLQQRIEELEAGNVKVCLRNAGLVQRIEELEGERDHYRAALGMASDLITRALEKT